MSPPMREAQKKQAVINAAQDRHFSDPDVGRRFTQLAAAKHPEVHAAHEKAWDAAKVTTMQRLTKSATPVYPISARISGLSGGLWIAFVIGEDGVPHSVEWLPDPEGLQAQSFVDSAIAAVRQWRFEPAKVDGRPIATVTVVPILFQFPF